MTVLFTVRKEEREKFAFILDSDLSDSEKDQKLIEYLHQLIAAQPVPIPPPVAPFVWDTDAMHPYIKAHGPIFCWLDGSSKDIQTFVEHMSRQTGYMFDWAFQAGRAHIDYDPNGEKALREYLEQDPEPWNDFDCRRIG